MSTKRETVYVCTFTSSGRTVTTHVRAWDAAGARREFLRGLDGTAGRGVVAVSRPRRAIPAPALAAAP